MTVPYIDGHCQTQGRPDQYHHLCPGGFRSSLGVEHVCTCPNHETPAVERDSTPNPLANDPSTWENRTSPQGAETPAGSDHLTLSTNERG